uniref:Apolipoprotein D n=1 Tax=Riptortus pedestris TaxID=329032 RepID=R4WDZ0_RIPPE|nr:unknown secreted protein [Riptortus pedestris]
MRYQANIKLTLMLLAVGIAVYAGPATTNIPLALGFCKNPPIGPKFITNEFFNKQWYPWKGLGNMIFKRPGGCSGIDAKIEGSTIKVMTFHYEPLFSGYVTIEGEADNRIPRHQGLWFTIDYHIMGLFHLPVPYTVLATDYSNWAVVYSCHQLLGFKIERTWILARTLSPNFTSETLSAIRSALETIDIDLEDLRFEDNSGCGQGEPRL